MTSFVEYHGADSVYTLGRTWRPNDRISVSELCKDFGERAGDTSGGDVFLNWLSSKLESKPKFSLHIDSKDLAGLVAQGTQGGKEVVESGQVSVASSAEAAAANLTNPAAGQQVSATPQNQAGVIEETEAPPTRSNRTKRVSSVQAVKEALQQESEPMTGDMLEVQHSRDTAGAASDTFVAQPGDSTKASSSKTQAPPMVIANPSPSLSPSKVSTGREGVITNLPQVTDDPANIVPQDRRTEPTVNKVSLEQEVITGDDLASAGDPEASAAPESSTSEASAIGGKKRPAFQGTVGAREVTLDHIVRAANFHQAIDAVNRCKDRTILNVAKRQLSNAGGAQKVVEKIDSRIASLKKRGL